MLESIFSQGTQVSISLESCLICILVSIILGVAISFTHKITTKTTPNFLLTLAVLPVLVQVVIFLVNGNLGTAFAVAGAFGLVRFRSMPGNSKEIVSVFWAMAARIRAWNGVCNIHNFDHNYSCNFSYSYKQNCI